MVCRVVDIQRGIVDGGVASHIHADTNRTADHGVAGIDDVGNRELCPIILTRGGVADSPVGPTLIKISARASLKSF